MFIGIVAFIQVHGLFPLILPRPRAEFLSTIISILSHSIGLEDIKFVLSELILLVVFLLLHIIHLILCQRPYFMVIKPAFSELLFFLLLLNE